MEQTRLTVRLPRVFLEGAERDGNDHNITLPRLASEYLRRLGTQDDPLADAPVVRRLSGTLSHAASVDHYRKCLEEKGVDVLICQGGIDYVCG